MRALRRESQWLSLAAQLTSMPYAGGGPFFAGPKKWTKKRAFSVIAAHATLRI